MVKNLPECRRPGFIPWVRKIPWRRKWQPTPVFIPGESHEQRSLVGYTPWGLKELDMTEWLLFHFRYYYYTHLIERKEEALRLANWSLEEIGFNMGLIPDTTSQPRSYMRMPPALPAVFTLTLLAFSVLSLCLTFYLLPPSTLDQDLLSSRGIW